MTKFNAEIEIKNGQIYITPNYDCKDEGINEYLLLDDMITQNNVYVLPF